MQEIFYFNTRERKQILTTADTDDVGVVRFQRLVICVRDERLKKNISGIILPLHSNLHTFHLLLLLVSMF